MSRSLLASRQTANFLQNHFVTSQNAGAAWVKDAINTPTLVDVDGPFGGQISAIRLVENGAAGTHRIYPVNTQTFVANSFWTFSCFFKNDTRGFAGLTIDMGSGNNNTIINLATGATVSTSISVLTTATISRTIRTHLNGWFHVIMTMFIYAQTVVLPAISLSTNGTTLSYVGDNSSAIYIYNPQVVKANWEGPLTATSGANNTNPIRNALTSRAAYVSRASLI